MTDIEAVEFANKLKNNDTINFEDMPTFCDMAIEALVKIDAYKALLESEIANNMKLGRLISKQQEHCEKEAVNKDTDFVPVEIEFLGRKGSGYLYKPQQIIVTGYFTLETFKHFGGKYKEKEGKRK